MFVLLWLISSVDIAVEYTVFVFFLRCILVILLVIIVRLDIVEKDPRYTLIDFHLTD